jgi:glycosyltransferase involved in cell wall biosynthesis
MPHETTAQAREAPAPGPRVDLSRVGLVAIGRNEGERLARALEAVVRKIPCVVYVDSGSTDGSLETARRLGAHVAELDPSQAFTHAKGRNLGFETLSRLWPEVELVHFLDGDCEIVAGWLEHAVSHLDAHPEVVWVCGRVIELFPERSIYNRLRWMEWNWDPLGEVDGSAGNGLARVRAIREVGAFNGELIAGADLEICLRLRQKGGKIHRLDADMCRHDSAMFTYRSWWNRNLRAGHVCAEGVWMHGREPERYHVRQWLSNAWWGLGWPLLALALAWPTHGWSLLLLALYPLKMAQVAWRMLRRGYAFSDACLFAAFCLFDKLPQALGQLRFLLRTLRQRGHVLIEYK